MIKIGLIIATLLNMVVGSRLEEQTIVTEERIPRDAFFHNSTDKFKTFQDIANENGFRVEVYQIVTEDGYILETYRIPGKLSERDYSNKAKPSILL